MRSKNLLCASYGSLKDNVASYSYRILKQSSPHGIHGGGICYGYKHQLSSLRAESFGALALIIVINEIVRMHKQPHDSLEYWVYIDNKEVIRRINNTTTLRLTEYYAPEYEISEEITSQIRNTCAKGHWLWIKSHTEAQDQASIINWYVDKLVEHFRIQNVHKLSELSFPSNKATILYNNAIINTKVFDHLQNKTSNTTLRKYLQNKYGWSDSTFQDINWSAHRGALLSMPTPLRITTIKIIHNWGATGIRNKLIEKKTNQCPFCNEEKETSDHVFECPKHDITTMWSSLHRNLLGINTIPTIQGCLKKSTSVVSNPLKSKTLPRLIN